MMKSNPAKLTEKEWEAMRKNRAVRLKISQDSFFWFFHLYFHHYITHPTAKFQQELMNLASDPKVEQLVVVAFRESGKSTLISTVLPLWSIIGNLRKKYVVLVSQTQHQVQQHLANVARELESNALLHKDFWPYDYEENELGVTAINLPKFGARIIAVSREQGMRGLRHGPHRPDLIIADDVEDSRTVKNGDSRNRNFSWFTGELLPLGSENTKYVIVGNLLHEDSLMMRLKAGIESGERSGVYREYPLEHNGKALWPERFPDRASLKKLERRIADRIRFEREYRLRLIPDDDQIVTPNMIQTYKTIPQALEGEYRQHAISIDIAISERDSADYTAIVQLIQVGRKHRRKIYVKASPFNKRIRPYKTMNKIRELAELYPKAKIIVESTAAQATFADLAENEGISVTGVTPRDDKRTRLTLIADKIADGTILFPVMGCEELISQLTGFGVETHDDLVDALTMGVIELLKAEKNEGTVSWGRHNLWSAKVTPDRNKYWVERFLENDPYGWPKKSIFDRRM